MRSSSISKLGHSGNSRSHRTHAAIPMKSVSNPRADTSKLRRQPAATASAACSGWASSTNSSTDVTMPNPARRSRIASFVSARTLFSVQPDASRFFSCSPRSSTLPNTAQPEKTGRQANANRASAQPHGRPPQSGPAGHHVALHAHPNRRQVSVLAARQGRQVSVLAAHRHQLIQPNDGRIIPPRTHAVKPANPRLHIQPRPYMAWPSLSSAAHRCSQSTYDAHMPGLGKRSIADIFPIVLPELARVVVRRGIVLVKLADSAHRSRFRWEHVELVVAARSLGLTPCDLLVRTNDGNLVGPNWDNVRQRQGVPGVPSPCLR